MSDLIRRTDVIDFLEQQKQSILIGSAGYMDANEIPDTIEVLKTILSSQLTIKSVQQWIPCSERLPETDKNRKYLVCGEKGGIYIAEFVCNTVNGTSLGMSWWSAHGRYCPNPIAWMSLPEPYKGE